MAVMTEPLFPITVVSDVDIPDGISADRRRTLRRLRIIEAGRNPITDLPLHPDAPYDASRRDRFPRPFTCGTCAHRYMLSWHNKNYPKCELVAPAPHAAHSATKDTYRWLPACVAYQPIGTDSDDGVTPIAVG